MWYLVGTAERRELISSTYYRWFKSYDDAIAEINRRQNADSEKDSKKRLSEAAPQLLEALEEITEMYCALINSGDCGNWNPETDKEVIKSRAAIKAAKGE